MRFNTRLTQYFFMLGCLFLTACGTVRKPITACEKIDGIEPICGFNNPEDMDLLPDNQTLIVSQIGNINNTATGKLVFFDSKSQRITTAFPWPLKGIVTPGNNWGAQTCPGIPGLEFSPIGISLRQRNDGRWQVAAVNQGQRIR